jgi:phospholipid/cholesterol/gamma-HCH transport system substrate-binding protein
MTQETKVGLLVIGALLILGAISLRSGSMGFGNSSSPMREFSSTFRDVEGVKPGSLVKMAGVDVGEVKGVELQPSGSAVLHFKVRKNVALPADVSAQITTSGLIGDRFVALVPGPQGSMGQGGMLPADASVIPASAAADPSQIGNSFAKVAGDLETMTGTLKSVLGDPENAQKLQQIIDGLAQFSGNIGPDSGRIMANLDKTTANLAVLTDNLRNGKGALGQLLADNGKDNLGGTMGDLNSALRDLKDVMAKINNGQGTIGKLVNDPQTAEKLDNALDTFSEMTDRVEQLRTEVALEGSTLTNEKNVGSGDLTVTLQPRPTRFYVIGAHSDGFATAAKDHGDPTNPYYGQDFGHKTKYTAQFGHVFQNAVGNQDVAVRVGLKNSTGGVGVDTTSKVPFTDKDVTYSADVYDFSGNDTPGSKNAHLDLTARADIVGKVVYGMVGYDNLLNQEYGSPKVGVGIRFQDDDLKYLVGRSL